jgi:hypothetical protein
MSNTRKTPRSTKNNKVKNKEPLPGVRSKDKDRVIAILCSDLHLTSKTPTARAEVDWYDVQADYLKQLRLLQKEHQCNVIIAGDIFDKYNPSPELINFAIKQLPDECYAIPGQHDLPMHSYVDITQSGYYTLVLSGKIKNLPPGAFVPLPMSDYQGNAWGMIGWPWGSNIKPPSITTDDKKIAVVHHYLWTAKAKHYPDALKMDNASHWWTEKLRSYNAAVFGDNHIGFLTHTETHCPIFNCGTFIRRKLDERKYTPQVGLLWASGKISRHHFTFKDQWRKEEEIVGELCEAFEMNDFVTELLELTSNSLDFTEALKQATQKSPKSIRQLITKILETIQ